MVKDVVILSDYDGLPQQSKAQAGKLLLKILEMERIDPGYRIRFSPELTAYCRRGFRGLSYLRVLKIAKSGNVVRKEPPTTATREWRYILRGLSAGKKEKSRFELVFSFEDENSVVFITCYPVKRKGAKR